MPLAGAMSPTEHQEEAGKRAAQRKGLMANMLPLRQRFAKGIRQLAEVTADHLSRLAHSSRFRHLGLRVQSSNAKP